MGGFATTRRSFLAAAGIGLLAGACNREDEGEGALIASAARNGMRQTFVDTVGWMEPGGHALVVAFVPWLLSERERQDAVAARGVYPALNFQRPLLEVRFEVGGTGKEQSKVSQATLRALQFTFWFFDDPTPVIRVEQRDWPAEPDLEVIGLDGEIRRGGYVLGTIRGRRLYKNARDVDEAYLVNLRFAQSLA